MDRIRIWSGVLILAGLVLTVGGCGNAATPTAAPWTLTVIVTGTERHFSLAGLEALPEAEIRYTAKETGQENTYQGVRLRDLLNAAGADLDSLREVEVEATDGFSAIYPSEMALRDTSVLVYRMDGAPLPGEMGQVRMLSPGESSRFQVKFVTCLTVR